MVRTNLFPEFILPVNKSVGSKQQSTSQVKRATTTPLHNTSSGGRISTQPKGSDSKAALAQQKSGNSLGDTDAAFVLSKESRQMLGEKSVKGTEEMDTIAPRGELPNLIEAFGGDDIIDLTGGSGGRGQQTQIDGGKGDDGLFVGSEMGQGRNFNVVDNDGKTVAKSGIGGDNVQIKDVETVIAGHTLHGTKGDDNLKSDFQSNSPVKLVETHNVNGGAGNDNIAVATGNTGTSEVNLIPGPGHNKVQFDGGRSNDRVYYGSERGGDAKAPGRDQVKLHGGEGTDQLSIASQNYSLSDSEGKVLSKQGEGADKISADGFEQIWVNGEELKLNN
jgi:hypothetical protein